MMMETLARRIERTEEENDHPWEAKQSAAPSAMARETKISLKSTPAEKVKPSTTCWRSSTPWRVSLQG